MAVQPDKNFGGLNAIQFEKAVIALIKSKRELVLASITAFIDKIVTAMPIANL